MFIFQIQNWKLNSKKTLQLETGSSLDLAMRTTSICENVFGGHLLWFRTEVGRCLPPLTLNWFI